MFCCLLKIYQDEGPPSASEHQCYRNSTLLYLRVKLLDFLFVFCDFSQDPTGITLEK